MSISFNIEAARKFVRHKEEKRRKLLTQKYKKATAECKAIINMIITKYKPSRIWQWGSLVHKERFSEISDIDIAVEGITDEQTFFNMFGEADKLTSFSLDLVQIEKIHALHAESIKKQGKLVYEKCGNSGTDRTD